MRHTAVISLLCMILLSTISLADTDVYVDDSYYWFSEDYTEEITEPVYDRHAKELVFIEDTTAQQPDTVRMRVLSK